MSINKIGMYKTDEILEFMTKGEGRGFLGRSMFDAMYFEIERLNDVINELEKHCETMLSIFEQMTDEQRQEQLDKYKIYDGFLRRIQELKGSVSNK